MHPALKILLGIVIACVLLVGGCTAALWFVFAPEPGAAERRDAIRATHGALLQQLASAAQGATDLEDAAAHLRGVALPDEVLGLSLWQSDSDEHRIVIRRQFEGRQMRHVVINGAGSVTLVDRDGEERVFDVLQAETALADGEAIDIELALSRVPMGAGPE